MTKTNLLVALTLAFLLSACGNKQQKATDSVPSDSPAVGQVEEFHADNDIAMTVRSLVDAIRVREPLDSADYNFNGVLTDGEGRPIYANLHGQPGGWNIHVHSPSSATLHNLEAGDLLPDDLEMYILTSLDMTNENLVDSLCRTVSDGTVRRVYDFKGGLLQFEVQKCKTKKGIETNLITIKVERI